MESELKTIAHLDNLPQVLAWVRSQLKKTELKESEKKRVEVALEEAVVNVMMHGTKGGELEIELFCKHEPSRQIVFVLKDAGPPFNPLVHVSEPKFEESLEEREPGGLGLSIIRKFMDVLLYRREGDQNILILIKKLEISQFPKMS